MSWTPSAPSFTIVIIGRRKRDISVSPSRGFTQNVVTQVWLADSHSPTLRAL
jgi:hypothetical protein